jgi:hypothetical protein
VIELRNLRYIVRHKKLHGKRPLNPHLQMTEYICGISFFSHLILSLNLGMPGEMQNNIAYVLRKE